MPTNYKQLLSEIDELIKSSESPLITSKARRVRRMIEVNKDNKVVLNGILTDVMVLRVKANTIDLKVDVEQLYRVENELAKYINMI